MSQEIQITENKMPTMVELYENPELKLKQDQMQHYLNMAPPEKWVKLHPFISGYKYLPIDKVEYLLKKIYKKFNVEIKTVGTAFNGVYVTIRLHYRDLVTGEMEFQDGVGAIQLQTAKGTSPADLANINNGALSMAFPLAKTIAIKDAADMLGDIFGANLNRKDVMAYQMDTKLLDHVKSKEEQRMLILIESCASQDELEKLRSHLTEEIKPQFEQKWEELQQN